MRKLIVRAFNISLDGVSAEYGTEYFEWCMSGIDPRVPEVAGPHQLQAGEGRRLLGDVGKYGPLDLVSSMTLSNGTLELECRRHR